MSQVRLLKAVTYVAGDKDWLMGRISAEPLPEKARVLAYMRTGLVLRSYTSRERDVLGGKSLPPGVQILTDGVWAWSSSLCYWVDHHNLRLPRDFLESMAASGWCPPSHLELESQRKARVFVLTADVQRAVLGWDSDSGDKDSD